MKRIWILLIIVIIILGVIFIPKLILNKGDDEVKFKTLESEDIPQQLQEVLPKYKYEEKALGAKINEEVYVVVTRGEKMTGGYSVTIEKIEKIKKDDHFEIIVYAKYKDPKPDEIVPQVITYPHIVVKTELNKLPEKIKLEVEYID